MKILKIWIDEVGENYEPYFIMFKNKKDLQKGKMIIERSAKKWSDEEDHDCYLTDCYEQALNKANIDYKYVMADDKITL